MGAGYGLGDGLRRFVGTPGAVLGAPGMIGSAETLRRAPAVRPDGLRGGVRGWDGQLIDDARLVVAIARTAAGYGASVLTRVEAISAVGDRAVLRDAVSGSEIAVRAGAVVSATGVWAGELDPSVRLRPSRGTHLVVASERLGGADVSLTVPVAGSASRFVFTLPAPHGRTYIGLTDVPADGPLPDEPEATEPEIDMLLTTVNTVLARPLDRDDVIATFAGLRPLLAGAEASSGSDAGVEGADTSDLSRRHAILEGPSGVLSVVGGKLTTYRRMAEDAVDAVADRRFARVELPASSTRHIPSSARGRATAWARSPLPPGSSAATARRRRSRRRSPADRRPHAASPHRSCTGASRSRAPSTSTTCSTAAPGWAWWRRIGWHRRMPRPPPSSAPVSTRSDVGR
nr:hypothetical protein GCM10025699_20420 [Microbacterium flavescens]